MPLTSLIGPTSPTTHPLLYVQHDTEQVLIDGGPVEVDRQIAPLVSLLSAAGITTSYSCEHAIRPSHRHVGTDGPDGPVIQVVFPDVDELRVLMRLVRADPVLWGAATQQSFEPPWEYSTRPTDLPCSLQTWADRPDRLVTSVYIPHAHQRRVETLLEGVHVTPHRR